MAIILFEIKLVDSGDITIDINDDPEKGHYCRWQIIRGFSK